MSSLVITISRSSLAIKGCPRELADELSYIRQDISYIEGNFTSTPVRVSFVHYDDASKCLRGYPNSLHLISKAAGKLGLSLDINDQRMRPKLELSNLDKERFRTVCFQALEAVAASNSSGQITAPPGVGKTSIICGLAKMLPTYHKILVTTDDRQVVKQIHQALTEHFPQEKVGIHIKPHSSPARIIVTNLDALEDFTRGELAYSGYALRDFDAWICDEVHRLPVPKRIPILKNFRPLYSWGLTATPKRADNSHQLNSVIFGESLFEIGHREAIDVQTQTGEKGIVPMKVLVFPLLTERPIPEEWSHYAKLRAAFLRNPKLDAMLSALNAQLPAESKALYFVDTLRQGVLMKRLVPGAEFVHGKLPLSKREEILNGLRTGALNRVICTDIWSEGIDIPDLDFVVDVSGKLSPALITQRAGRAGRGAPGKNAGHYVMLLCLGSAHLFNHGISKIRRFNGLGWNVRYMFSREIADKLTFEQAPLLPEWGEFVKIEP